MAYGIGGGLAEGVKTAGTFLIPAMQAKMDQNYRYDYLAAMMGWQNPQGKSGGAPAGADESASIVPSTAVTETAPKPPGMRLGELRPKPSTGPRLQTPSHQITPSKAFPSEEEIASVGESPGVALTGTRPGTSNPLMRAMMYRTLNPLRRR